MAQGHGIRRELGQWKSEPTPLVQALFSSCASPAPPPIPKPPVPGLRTSMLTSRRGPFRTNVFEPAGGLPLGWAQRSVALRSPVRAGPSTC